MGCWLHSTLHHEGLIVMERLQEILATMEIPSTRCQDLRWLGRNLGVRNGAHPHFHEAVGLIRHLQGGI